MPSPTHATPSCVQAQNGRGTYINDKSAHQLQLYPQNLPARTNHTSSMPHPISSSRVVEHQEFPHDSATAAQRGPPSSNPSTPPTQTRYGGQMCQTWNLKTNKVTEQAEINCAEEARYKYKRKQALELGGMLDVDYQGQGDSGASAQPSTSTPNPTSATASDGRSRKRQKKEATTSVSGPTAGRSRGPEDANVKGAKGKRQQKKASSRSTAPITTSFAPLSPPESNEPSPATSFLKSSGTTPQTSCSPPAAPPTPDVPNPSSSLVHNMKDVDVGESLPKGKVVKVEDSATTIDLSDAQVGPNNDALDEEPICSHWDSSNVRPTSTPTPTPNPPTPTVTQNVVPNVTSISSSDTPVPLDVTPDHFTPTYPYLAASILANPAAYIHTFANPDVDEIAVDRTLFYRPESPVESSRWTFDLYPELDPDLMRPFLIESA